MAAIHVLHTLLRAGLNAPIIELRIIRLLGLRQNNGVIAHRHRRFQNVVVGGARTASNGAGGLARRVVIGALRQAFLLCRAAIRAQIETAIIGVPCRV